jgi:hypothetical protein
MKTLYLFVAIIALTVPLVSNASEWQVTHTANGLAIAGVQSGEGQIMVACSPDEGVLIGLIAGTPLKPDLTVGVPVAMAFYSIDGGEENGALGKLQGPSMIYLVRPLSGFQDLYSGLMSGSWISVKYVSASNRWVEHTFSLKGSTAAIMEVQNGC